MVLGKGREGAEAGDGEGNYAYASGGVELRFGWEAFRYTAVRVA